MSVGAFLVLLGLVVALVGAALVWRARLRARPAVGVLTASGRVDDFGDLVERAQETFRATDRAVRAAVLLAVAGLLVSVVGAYLLSDFRLLGATIGGPGGSESSDVGGSW